MIKVMDQPVSRLLCWYLAMFLAGVLSMPTLAAAAFVPVTLDPAPVEAATDRVEDPAPEERYAEEGRYGLDALTPGEQREVLSDTSGEGASSGNGDQATTAGKVVGALLLTFLYYFLIFLYVIHTAQ